MTLENVLGALALFYVVGGMTYFFILLIKEDLSDGIFIPIWPLLYLKAVWRRLKE